MTKATGLNKPQRVALRWIAASGGTVSPSRLEVTPKGYAALAGTA